ncbi:MAG: N-acetylmuramoyl-L-alanine amidase [Clostridia bacterium]|nr:N-acetylmuramoyl-L-alanine amidase [Clostridia bacterium]
MAIKIYIDQGHNPENPNAGAEANGVREQDITYEVGQALYRKLSANASFEARLSRPTPETQLGTSNTTSLAARVADANAWGADYFISLHTNAAADPTATGSEAFVYSRSSPAFPLAEDILLWMRYMTGLRTRGVFVRPGLYVLRNTAMPAVLVEMGFITNPDEAALMSGDPELFAEGIYRGILQYFGMI